MRKTRNYQVGSLAVNFYREPKHFSIARNGIYHFKKEIVTEKGHICNMRKIRRQDFLRWLEKITLIISADKCEPYVRHKTQGPNKNPVFITHTILNYSTVSMQWTFLIKCYLINNYEGQFITCFIREKTQKKNYINI